MEKSGTCFATLGISNPSGKGDTERERERERDMETTPNTQAERWIRDGL